MRGNELTLDDSSHILVQSRFPWTGLLITLPVESKPRMSLPTLLVRPLSISCLCLNSFCRAKPLPLSSSPCVNTPSRVLLPASTLPTTATLQCQSYHCDQLSHLTFDVLRVPKLMIADSNDIETPIILISHIGSVWHGSF